MRTSMMLRAHRQNQTPTLIIRDRASLLELASEVFECAEGRILREVESVQIRCDGAQPHVDAHMRTSRSRIHTPAYRTGTPGRTLTWPLA